MPNLTFPKRLSNGKYIDLGNLTIDDIDLPSINRSLNYLYRFNGHFKDKPPLTVAQHTRLVVKIAEMLFPGEADVKFDCLIHDFPESITGDVSTNMKKILGTTFKDFEHGIEQVFYDALWVSWIPPFTEECYHKRKICDLTALDIERRSMWTDQTGKVNWPTADIHTGLSLKDKQALFDEIQAERFYDVAREYQLQLGNGQAQ